MRGITEQKAFEEHLRQASKMEAIGQLAGGIAHDFNNILGCILGYGELAKQDLAHPDLARDHIDEMLRASHRAKELVRQILMFSRQHELVRRPMSLVPVVSEALKLLRSSLPSTIDLRLELESEAPSVLSDPTQIHQVLMNLATNAADAMNARGELTVRLARVRVEAELARTNPDFRVGAYALLSVRDTGCGMDSELQHRIFEPFFTTKGPGQGTGLGLAVVHGIVKAHDGAIRVLSEPGKGATFELYFPACNDSADRVPLEGGPIAPGHGERVLFVDDEAVLVMLNKKMLERAGYRVTAKTSPVDALAEFRKDPTQFDLVFTDLTMPSLTGSDLAAELHKIRPNIPVIMMTGFSGALTPAGARALGIQELIFKPATAQSLTEAAHRVLATERGG